MWAALLGLMLVCSTRIFLPLRGTGLRRFAIEQQSRCFFPVDPSVDVTCARDFKFFKARHLAEPGNHLLCDLAWRLAQLLGQLKAQRQCIFTQTDVGRLIDHNARQFHIILLLQEVSNALGKLLL